MAGEHQRRHLAFASNGTKSIVYTYDADGLRTGRTDGDTAYAYVYVGTQLVQMIVTTTVDNGTPTTKTLNFAYDASGTPATVTYDGAIYYYITNLQGDVMAILDSSGTAVVQYTYDAWGKILSTTGTMASTLGEANPLRYRGYVYDTETETYYLQSRYYDPELGRFINADALLSAGQGIIGYNIYTYCLNNPVRYKDASGVAAEEATDVEDDQDDKEPGTRVVGAGIQVDFDYSLSTGGFEIIMYWDSTVCGEGNWKVAVYGYNGVCINMDDPIIESVIACMMANADLLSMEDNAPSTAFIQAVMLAIPTDLSIGLSGVVVIGNNKFDNTEDYTEGFTSVNVSWNRVRGSYAYADACEAFTLGFNVKGRPIIPSRTISQTFYYCVGEITFAAPF